MKSTTVIPKQIQDISEQIMSNFVVVQKEGEEETHDIKNIHAFVNDNGDWEIRIVI